MYLSYQCAHSLKILKYFQIGKKTEIEWHMVYNITNQSYIKLYSLLRLSEYVFNQNSFHKTIQDDIKFRTTIFF